MFTRQRRSTLAHFVVGKRPSGMMKFFQIQQLWVQPQIGQGEPGGDTQSSHHSGGVFLYPGNSSSSINLLYTRCMCEHVYKDLGTGLCPKCGLHTHSTDWVKQNQLMREYKEKVGYFYNTNEWWSI